MKNKKKETILLIGISMLIASLSYLPFLLKGYYSIDAEEIMNLGMKDYAFNYFFYDGRIFMGFICLLFPVSQALFYQIQAILAIVIGSICVKKIYNIILHYKPTENNKTKILLGLLEFCYIFNFMWIDSMQFINAIMIAVSILFYILSAENLIVKEDMKMGILYGVLAIFSYQGSISIYWITIILLLLLKQTKNKLNLKKESKRIVGTMLIVLGLSILYQEVVKYFIITIQLPRLDFNLLQNLLNTCKNIVYLFFENLDLFPNYLYSLFLIALLIFAYSQTIKIKKVKLFINAILLILMSYISGIALGLIYPNLLMLENGRMFTGVGACFSVVAIYLYCNTDLLETKSITKKLLIATIISYFLITSINTFYITKFFQKGNEIDNQFSQEIKQTIEKYEEETNEKIEKMAIRYVRNEPKKLEKIEKATFKKSKKLLGLYNTKTYQLYTNELLEREYFKEEWMEEIYAGKEEIICQENIVFLFIEY